MKKNTVLFSRGRIRPLLFAEPLSGADDALLLKQMKGRVFDPSLVSAIARRCSKGFPAVIQCTPLKGATPFPTSFWLTCPWLVRLCGKRESEGAIGILEEALKRDRSSWTEFHCHAARLRILSLPAAQRRFLRRYRPRTWRSLAHGGVGGIEYLRCGGGGVKCLHLQVASWLALGAHPAGDILERLLSPLECGASSRRGCVYSS